MGQQVALDKRAIAHGDAASISLEWALAADVGQSDLRGGILSVLLISSRNSARNTLTTHFVSLSPV